MKDFSNGVYVELPRECSREMKNLDEKLPVGIQRPFISAYFIFLGLYPCNKINIKDGRR